MNQDCIKKWLVACGQEWGANHAYLYRLPDPSTRPTYPYFIYRILKGAAKQDGIQNETTKVGDYDINRSGGQLWDISLSIDLFNSDDGFNELAACAVAAVDDPDIIKILDDGGCAFQSNPKPSITNKTTENDDRLYYQHSLVCWFKSWLGYSHFKRNEIIESVDSDNAVTID